MRCPNVRLSKNASLHISNQKEKKNEQGRVREGKIVQKIKDGVMFTENVKKNGFCVHEVYVNFFGENIFLGCAMNMTLGCARND